MRKEMHKILNLFEEYGIGNSFKNVNKIFKNGFESLVQGEEADNIVCDMIDELVRGEWSGHRIVKDEKKFALKTGMHSEKERMLEMYGNSHYFVYNKQEGRIKAYPFRTFRGYEQVNQNFVLYKENFSQVLDEKKSIEYKLKKAFNEMEALEYLRKETNRIFESLRNAEDMEMGLAKLRDELKILLNNAIEEKIKRKAKEEEKKKKHKK